MIAIVILVGQATSPGLLSTYNLQTMAINNTVLACLAFGVAPVIIAADIDISIASMLALCGVVMAKLWGGGMDIWLAALVGDRARRGAGARQRVVRGAARPPGVGGDAGNDGGLHRDCVPDPQGSAIVDFPIGLLNLGSGTFAGTQIETSTVVVVGLMLVLTFVVHVSPYGRSLFAVGANRQAALFSGLAVIRTRLVAF